MSSARSFLFECLQILAAQRVLGFLMLGLGTIAAASMILTVGEAQASRRAVLGSIDNTANRLVVLTDDSGQGGMPAGTALSMERSESVEWALAVSKLEDAALARTHAGPISVRTFDGPLPDSVDLVSGRLPLSGEAIIDNALLQSFNVGPWTAIEWNGSAYPIVGTYTLDSSLKQLSGIGLIASPTPELVVSRILVMFRSLADVRLGQGLVLDLARPERVEEISISSNLQAFALQVEIAQELERSRRRQALQVLVAMTVVTLFVALALVLVQREYFGLKRSLGASRSRLTALIVASSAIAPGFGALLGSIAAVLSQGERASTGIEPSFVLATVVTIVASSVLGAVPPAIAAGLRDPIYVLRTL